LSEFATEYEFFKSKVDLEYEDSDSGEDQFLDEEVIVEIGKRQTFRQQFSKLMVRKKNKSAVLKTPFVSLIEIQKNTIMVYLFCISHLGMKQK